MKYDLYHIKLFKLELFLSQKGFKMGWQEEVLMIIFLLGILIGGFLGITFMAIFFIGKKEDERRHELYDNIEVNYRNQKQPSTVEQLKTSLYKYKPKESDHIS